jgi:hypothetical protein
MARVAWLATVAAVVAVTACSAAHPARQGSPAPSRSATGTAAPAPAPPAMPQLSGPPPVPGANYATGGCGPRPLLSGALPSWTASASPPAMIYVLGRHQQIAGFLFGFPLMAGHPEPFSDKILWVVRSDRHGAPLRLTGRPLNAATPVVRSSWPANSSPGNIYPSDIEVPAPGCWRFTLTWHRHTDTVDLWYVRHR